MYHALVLNEGLKCRVVQLAGDANTLAGAACSIQVLGQDGTTVVFLAGRAINLDGEGIDDLYE